MRSWSLAVVLVALMGGGASARGIDQGGSFGLSAFGGIAYGSSGLDFPVGGGVGLTWFNEREQPKHTFGAEAGLLVSSGLGFVRPYYGVGVWWLTIGGGPLWGMGSEKVFALSPDVTFHLRRRSGVWRPAIQAFLQGNVTLNRSDAFPHFIGFGLRLLIDL